MLLDHILNTGKWGAISTSIIIPVSQKLFSVSELPKWAKKQETEIIVGFTHLEKDWLAPRILVPQFEAHVPWPEVAVDMYRSFPEESNGSRFKMVIRST